MLKLQLICTLFDHFMFHGPTLEHRSLGFSVLLFFSDLFPTFLKFTLPQVFFQLVFVSVFSCLSCFHVSSPSFALEVVYTVSPRVILPLVHPAVPILSLSVTVVISEPLGPLVHPLPQYRSLQKRWAVPDTDVE